MHPTQQKLLEFSKEHDLSLLGYRRIGRLIGVNNPQTVKHHIQQLIKKGYLKNNKNLNYLKISKKLIPSSSFISIPVYGSANCGVATFIAEDRIEGYLKISRSLLVKKNVIAIKAVGNSMNKANIGGLNIEDGDYVLVDLSNKSPKNGDYVLSIIENCANIKRFYRINIDQIALISESTEKLEPIYISSKDSYLIVGVVVQVIKNLNQYDSQRTHTS